MFLKKNHFLFLAFCLASLSASAQEWVKEFDLLSERGDKFEKELNWEKAADYFREAYTIANSNSDSVRAVKAGMKIVNQLWSQNLFRESFDFLTDLEKLINTKTPSAVHAELVYMIGATFQSLGDFAAGEKEYERGLSIANPDSDLLIIAKLSMYLSSNLLYTAEYEEGHILASRAIEIYEQLGFNYELSRANLFKYNIYLYQGDLTNGEPYLKASHDYALSTNNSSLLTETYLFLSDLYERKNDHSLAITFSEKGLELAEQRNNALHKALYYSRLGNIYLKLSNPDRALTYFNRTHAYYESVGNKNLAVDALLKVAECFIDKKDYDIAEKLLLDALDYYENTNQYYDIGFTLDVLTHIKLVNKQYPEAYSYIEQNLENVGENDLIRVKTWIIEKILRLPDTYYSKEEKNEFARQLYNMSASLERETQIRSLKNFSYSFSELNYDSAVYYGEKALSLIEKKRFSLSEGSLKARIFADHSTFYNDLASWYANSEESYSRAFSLFEASKSRALFDQLAESYSNEQLNLPEETELLLLQKQKTIDQLYRKKEGANGEEVQKITDEIADAELDYEASIEEIRRAHPAWNSFVYPETLPLEEAQKKINKNTGILEYSYLKDGLAVMLITSGNIYYHQIENDFTFKEKFTEQINHFRDAIISLAPKDSLEEFSYSLYEALLLPFEKALQSLDQLIIIPDESIALLPFDALVHNGDYLVSKFTFKYLPSVSVFAQIQNPHRNSSVDLLAVAGSGFVQGSETLNSQTQNSFAALPFTLIEVDTLVAKFDNHKVLKNNAVSEAGIKNLSLNNYKYIHFATHGDINEIAPNQSGLILSKKNELEQLFGEDGFLNAAEISAFKLNADMVVLSACNTGSGKVINGEGLLGLQRSFLVAGASSVVASLWSIYDRSTPLFMSQFYNSLIEMEKKEFGWFDRLMVWGDWYTPDLIDYKSVALREAKLAMLDHPYYNHPAHWASFVLTGK